MALEFSLPSTYITPRAAKRAHAAGVMALGTDINQMEDIRQLLKSSIGRDLARDLPGLYIPIEETTLIIRWGGRLGLSTDVRYNGARSLQPYIRVDNFATTEEDVSWFSREEIQSDGPMIVEMAIKRWDTPQCGARFAEALLGYPDYPRGFLSNAWQILRQPATVEEALKKQLIADCQKQYPNPVSIFIADNP